VCSREGMARQFSPTHVISIRTPFSPTIPVRIERGEGPAYTQEEWASSSSASWEYSHERGLTLHGSPVQGTQIHRIGSRGDWGR
jgi:hypothetical protein